MQIQLVRLRDARTNDVLHFPKVESLALGYLAGFLKSKGLEAEIIDEEVMGLQRKQTIESLQCNSDIIAFTAIAKSQIYSILEVIKELKKNGNKAHITIGGQFATFLFRELLSLENKFDSVVLYEGEETLFELANALNNEFDLGSIKGLAFKTFNGQIKQNPLRPLICNLDSLPFPARDTLPKVIENGGLPIISSSRGCYNRCSYCSISQFYSGPGGSAFRYRSAGNVLAELKHLKEEFPEISDIWFVDDNFVVPGKKGLERTAKLCRGIKDLDLGVDLNIYLRANQINGRLLKLLDECSVRSIFIGAEAGTNYTLQQIFKKNLSIEQTKRAIKLCGQRGINVDPGFIMFHPWSTLKEIESNIRFLEEIGQFTLYGIVSFLTAYKFTPIGKEMLSGERTYKKPIFKSKELIQDTVPYEIADEKAEVLLCLTLKAFEEFHKLPEQFAKLKQEIRKIRSINKEKAMALDKEWTIRVNAMNRQGMAFFKELFRFIKKADLNDKSIKPFFGHFKLKIRSYVAKESGEIENLTKN
ncbi:MAG: B12-binding domain-containing radical SAM protein [Candidatus Diapherotrites archaeon]|nr:B12-binding domain-containing radical SAM protein [Candidatus Diapherotrites archaeon]